MASDNKILIIGAIFVDVIMNVRTLPMSGGDTTAALNGYHVGGCAYNVTRTIQSLRGLASADLFAPLGKGPYSDIVRATLSRHGIPKLIESSSGDNGWDLCLVEPNGERTFITVPGVEQAWQPAWFSSVNLANYDTIYLSGYEMEDVTSATIILDQLTNCKPTTQVLFDASPRIGYVHPRVLHRLLSMGTIFHANQDETALISGQTDLTAQARDIFDATKSPVVVTLGARGAYVYDQHGGRTIPTTLAPKMVNTIGAGDAHCGGILSGLANGMKIDQACTLGNQLAAKAISQTSGAL